MLIFKIQSDQNIHQNIPKLHHIFKIFSCSICPRAPSTYECKHGRPQEFFQGGANLWGGPKKTVKGAPIFLDKL